MRSPGAAGYAVLFAVALVARISLDLMPVQYVTAGQEKVWSWPFFGVFCLCFFVGALGWSLPLAVGGAVGMLTIGSDLLDPAAAALGGEHSSRSRTNGDPFLPLRGPCSSRSCFTSCPWPSWPG